MKKQHVDYKDRNTNELQYKGSCTAYSQTNALEVSYYKVLGKDIHIDAEIFWSWREDVKGIGAYQGSSFYITRGFMEEFQKVFGGLPCIVDGQKGIVKIGSLYNWGSTRSFWERLRKLNRELNRGYGVVCAFPVGNSTFSQCMPDGNDFLQNDHYPNSAHAECFEGYQNYKRRTILYQGVGKKVNAPEYYILGNSWGQTWSKDGTCKLSVHDFRMLYNDLSTLLPTLTETTESILSNRRKRKMLLAYNKLENNHTKELLRDFFEI